jgi:hypothetical protein
MPCAKTTGGCEPDLFVDGLACCDQSAAHHLAHAGLVRAIGPAKRGHRVLAELTIAGRVALENDLPRRPVNNGRPGTEKPSRSPSAAR